MPTLNGVLRDGEEAINNGVGPVYNTLNDGLKTVVSSSRRRRRYGTKRRSSSRRRRGTYRRRRGRR